MVPGKQRNSYHFFGQLENAGFRGFKLMEINVATAVFQVVSQYFGLGSFDKLFFFLKAHTP